MSRVFSSNCVGDLARHYVLAVLLGDVAEQHIRQLRSIRRRQVDGEVTRKLVSPGSKFILQPQQ